MLEVSIGNYYSQNCTYKILFTAGFALQSWLFAHLVEVFQFTGEKLKNAGNFWALMFFILALAMALFYYLLGYASNSISMVS